MNNDDNNGVNKPKSQWPDVLFGLLIIAAVYFAAYLIFVFALSTTPYGALLYLILIAVVVILIVKYYRSDRPVLATIILVLCSPLVLSLLLMGSCLAIFKGNL
jgi:hypothetical protein